MIYVMRDPLEMVVKGYFPWLRALTAFRLREMGMSQSKIARSLGVTQPSVALYLQRQRRFYFAKTDELGVPRELVSDQVERYAKAVAGGGLEPVFMTLKLATETLAGGSLCRHHRSEAGLPEDCDVCMRFFGTGGNDQRSMLLQDLRGAVQLIESSDTFPLLIPEVQSNFVSALPEARNEGDVAGIAGRIANAKGRARAASQPEFGASKYTAGIVLAAKRGSKGIRSGLNIKYDTSVGQIASSLGWRRVDLTGDTADGSGPALLKGIEVAVSELEGPLDMLVVSGALGLEASAYVFGSDPGDVAGKALTLANLYSKSLRPAN